MHQGSTGPKMQQRDLDHLRVWQALTLELRQEIAKQKTAVADMQDELDARPTRIVTENLDQQQVDEAKAERDQAYQSRDRAFHLLSAAALLHSEAEPNRCACGLQLQKCAVAQLLEEEGRGLRNWESKQRQRMEDGYPHSLPDNHPFVLDRRRRTESA